MAADRRWRARAALALQLLAPYLAVGVFWCGFARAWPAILAYHAQILCWSRGRRAGRAESKPIRGGWRSAPVLAMGPIIYFLLPHIARVDLADWLAAHGLTGVALGLMVPYFGLVHPALEQRHWRPLRDRTPWAHAFFAGYHVLVLSSLLPAYGLALCFAALTVTSAVWRALDRRPSDAGLVVLSHRMADLAIIVAAGLRA